MPIIDLGKSNGEIRSRVNIDNFPQSIVNRQRRDEALKVGAPPNFGKPMLPHIQTSAARVGSMSRTYLPSDEAMRHSVDNARYMRNECGIMECLEARQRGTCLLKWHIKPEDDKSKYEKTICQEISKIIERIPDFLEYRRNLLEALWFGKYGVQQVWKHVKVSGVQRLGVDRWLPMHGDKIIYRYDDGSLRYEPNQIGIRVGTGWDVKNRQRSKDFLGNEKHKVEPTQQGLAYFLDPWEHPLIAIHKHIIEDGAYEDPLQAGSIHGIGIRSRIYWTWYTMQECMALLMEYLERSALGFDIWPYQQGNPDSESRVRTAAEERVGGGRTIILVPVVAGDDMGVYMPQHFEPGLAGADALKSMIVEVFMHKIKRYILGQILTSEAEATGLGSGVADAHLATYLDIIRYDATKLSESITEWLVKPIIRFNFPRLQDCHIRFVIDTESPEVEKKLEALQAAWEMGAKIKTDDLYSNLGISRPDEEDDFLQKQEPQQLSSLDIGPPNLGPLAGDKDEATTVTGKGGRSKQKELFARSDNVDSVRQEAADDSEDSDDEDNSGIEKLQRGAAIECYRGLPAVEAILKAEENLKADPSYYDEAA